jgi:hypothetical protein
VVGRFHEGFWPGYDPIDANVPDTIDNSSFYSAHDPSSPEAKSLRAQRDEEIHLGWYSESFGTELLPVWLLNPFTQCPDPTPQNCISSMTIAPAIGL